MVDELQMAVRETTSPVTTSSVEIVESTGPVSMQCDSALAGEIFYPQAPVFDGERAGKLVDGVIAAVKDDRMNTKRAITADIASTARVQNQNDRVIDACELELRRRDLTEDQRMEILNHMSQAAEATTAASEASREFQKEQLEHSHKLPFKILGGTVVVALLWFGGRALLRAAQGIDKQNELSAP